MLAKTCLLLPNQSSWFPLSISSMTSFEKFSIKKCPLLSLPTIFPSFKLNIDATSPQNLSWSLEHALIFFLKCLWHFLPSPLLQHIHCIRPQWMCLLSPQLNHKTLRILHMIVNLHWMKFPPTPKPLPTLYSARSLHLLFQQVFIEFIISQVLY